MPYENIRFASRNYFPIVLQAELMVPKRLTVIPIRHGIIVRSMITTITTIITRPVVGSHTLLSRKTQNETIIRTTIRRDYSRFISYRMILAYLYIRETMLVEICNVRVFRTNTSYYCINILFSVR